PALSTLSLHDALPISERGAPSAVGPGVAEDERQEDAVAEGDQRGDAGGHAGEEGERRAGAGCSWEGEAPAEPPGCTQRFGGSLRSEEHTSELQSPCNL